MSAERETSKTLGEIICQEKLDNCLLGRLLRVRKQFGPDIPISQETYNLLTGDSSLIDWSDIFPKLVHGHGRGKPHCSVASSHGKAMVKEGTSKKGFAGNGRNGRSRW